VKSTKQLPIYFTYFISGLCNFPPPPPKNRIGGNTFFKDESNEVFILPSVFISSDIYSVLLLAGVTSFAAFQGEVRLGLPISGGWFGTKL
jgi:hypothetical protein